MSFLSRFRTRNRPAEEGSPAALVTPEIEPAPSPPAAPAPESAIPAPAEDEALAEAVLDAVERLQSGRAIQGAERIARQFQGTHAVLPLMTALQRLSAKEGPVGKAVAEAIRVAAPTPDQLDRLAEFAKDPSPIVRQYAMWKLGNLGDVATGPLVDGLRDPDDTVRMWAADALGPSSARDLRRAGPLIEALSDPHWLVRSRAARSLARLLVQTTTQAGYGSTVAPSAELVAEAMAALERALDAAKARTSGPGLEASSAMIAARNIAEAMKLITEARQ